MQLHTAKSALETACGKAKDVLNSKPEIDGTVLSLAVYPAKNPTAHGNIIINMAVAVRDRASTTVSVKISPDDHDLTPADMLKKYETNMHHQVCGVYHRSCAYLLCCGTRSAHSPHSQPSALLHICVLTLTIACVLPFRDPPPRRWPRI